MANLYGVANAPGGPLYVQFTSGADINCPGGANTVIWTTPPLIAPSAGYFYALVFLSQIITTTATPPTGLSYGVAIGAGSVVNNMSIPGSAMPTSGSIYVPMLLVTPISQTAWQGAGSVVNVTCGPGVNACSVRAFGSGIVVLLRAADQ